MMQDFLQFLQLQYTWMVAVGRTMLDADEGGASDLLFLDQGNVRACLLRLNTAPEYR